MNMETRTLGRTDLEVGMIGLGTEHLTANRENMDAVLDLAVPAGVNYFDLVYNGPSDAHADYWEAIGPAQCHLQAQGLSETSFGRQGR